MAKSQARREYERVYRNAKAKERRLKNNHNVDVEMNLLTPTEWAQAPNKKREIQKLDRFTERSNNKYDYISLGKESIKRDEYAKITADSKRINDQINYHKKKTLKRVMDKPYLFTTEDGTTLETDQKIEDRINKDRAESLVWQRDSSIEQGTIKGLKQYQAKQKRQLKNMKEMKYAKGQKANYIDKLEDFSRMFKGTSYNAEYKRFMKEMKKLSPEQYETFYYLSNMGAIDKIRYIADHELGTPEGQEKVYQNMKNIQSAWESVQKLISS